MVGVPYDRLENVGISEALMVLCSVTDSFLLLRTRRKPIQDLRRDVIRYWGLVDDPI